MNKTSYLPDIHRLLPQDADAEKGILASFVLSPLQVAQLCADEGVSEEHFHIPAHAIVFRTLRQMVADGKPIDFIGICTVLKASCELDAVGGGGFINGLFTFLPTAMNCAYYIGIVKKHAMARRVIELGTEYAARAYEPTEDAEKLAGEAHGAFSALLQKKSKRASVKEVLQQIVDEVREGKDDSGILKTGIEGLDGRLNIFKGDFIVITAPTSCGKTALAAQIVLSMAMRGMRVGFYPLEMLTKQMLSRAIGQMGGHNVNFVRDVAKGVKGEPNEFQRKTLSEFMDTARTIAKMKLHIRDDLFSAEEIFADIRVEHAFDPFSVIVIDYAQLIRTSVKTGSRQQEIASITQRCKQLASQLEVALIVPSQVNKEGGTREAQDLENDANSVLKIKGKENDKGEVEYDGMFVWKQRQGQRNIDIPLHFDPVATRFTLRKEDR